LNGVAVKVIDEAVAEAEGEVGGEIGVPGAGLGKISVEEAVEIGPSPRQTLLVGDVDGRRGTTTIPSSFVDGTTEKATQAVSMGW